MAELKSLAKDTAIYGASSIIGKFLNYFLVPIYTFSLPAASGGYGVITKMYAIVALLLVVLTFGMETGFFRFANKGDGRSEEGIFCFVIDGRGRIAPVFAVVSGLPQSYCRADGV